MTFRVDTGLGAETAGQRIYANPAVGQWHSGMASSGGLSDGKTARAQTRAGSWGA